MPGSFFVLKICDIYDYTDKLTLAFHAEPDNDQSKIDDCQIWKRRKELRLSRRRPNQKDDARAIIKVLVLYPRTFTTVGEPRQEPWHRRVFEMYLEVYVYPRASPQLETIIVGYIKVPLKAIWAFRQYPSKWTQKSTGTRKDVKSRNISKRRYLNDYDENLSMIVLHYECNSESVFSSWTVTQKWWRLWSTVTDYPRDHMVAFTTVNGSCFVGSKYWYFSQILCEKGATTTVGVKVRTHEPK